MLALCRAIQKQLWGAVSHLHLRMSRIIKSVCAMQDHVMIAFNRDQGMSWEQYISLYVRGAQQLYLHEAPKQALPLARL